MTKPKISFVCPSYNHEQYIDDFLNSLFSQTLTEWELIIINDCSKDNTLAKIKQYNDSRIHLIDNDFNRGMAYGLNLGIKKAKSDIISFVASDDTICKDYVKTIVKTFSGNPHISACYCPLQHMNNQGKVLKNKITRLPAQKSSEQIFQDLFINNNQLPSPGMAFRKSVIEKYLPLDIGMIQYSDWQLHFFTLFNNSVKLLDIPLINYRRTEKSASSRTIAALAREAAETDKLMETVVKLIGKDITAFKKYFGNHPLVKDKEILPQTIPFWLGSLAVTSPLQNKKLWGLKTVMNYINTEQNMQLLHDLYNYNYGTYMSYAANTETYESIRLKLKRHKKHSVILKLISIVMFILTIAVLVNNYM